MCDDWQHSPDWRTSFAGCFLSTVVKPSLDIDGLYALVERSLNDFAPGTPGALAIEQGGDPDVVWARLRELVPEFCDDMQREILEPVGVAFAAQHVDSFRDQCSGPERVTEGDGVPQRPICPMPPRPTRRNPGRTD